MRTDLNKVLILGTKNYDFDLSVEFSKIGFTAFFCGNIKSNLIPEKYWVQLDFTNIELIVQFLIKNVDFRFLIPGSNDLAYISACKVIQRIILNSKIQIDALKKAESYLLKSKFRKQKILEEVNNPKVFDLKNIETVEKKIVLKQDKMSGGKGVTFLQNGKNFKSFIKKNMLQEKFILEEFIDGSGHGASLFVKNSKIIYEFFDNEYYCKDKLAVVATSSPSNLKIDQKIKIKNFCLNYIKQNKLVDGLFHIQCIIKNKKVYIIECTRRLPGDYYHQFSSLSMDSSYLKYYLDGFLNNKKLPKIHKVKRNVVRIVVDELIENKIKRSDFLQNTIINNQKSKRELDGYRFSDENKKYKKTSAIFLIFDLPSEANYFCKKLIENL